MGSILWFPSPIRWQKGIVGTAGREHGDGKAQVVKGLLLLGPRVLSEPCMGPQGLLVGCIVGFKGSERKEAVGGDQGCGLLAAGRAEE